MEVVSTISLAMGSAWASGINLYATLFVLGFLNHTGNITLPANLQVLSEPVVMFAAGAMYFVEFVADKIPAVDTGWDAVHTFIRIPAGAILASQALGELSPAAEMAGLILGGGLAATTHAGKASTRVAINASPEPFTNWLASISEDVAAVGGLYAALHYPWLFLAFLVLFLILMIWLLPKLWRGIRRLFRTLGRWLGLVKEPPPPEEDPFQAIAPPLGEAGAVPGDTSQPPPGPPISRSQETRQKLSDLEELLAEGRITQEEYSDLRSKILHRLV